LCYKGLPAYRELKPITRDPVG